MPRGLLFAQGDDLDAVLPSRKLPLWSLAPPLHLPKYSFHLDHRMSEPERS